MASPNAAPKRGANYTASEDVAICKAYLAVTTDPIVGAEQEKKTYYKRIYEGYVERKPVDACVSPFSSVETRVKAILTGVTRFSGCYASVKAMKKSGVSEEDEIRLATAFYNKKKISHPKEDVGPPFKFLHSWKILRSFPKFSAAEQASPSAQSTTEDNEDGDVSTCEVEERESVETDGCGTKRKVPKFERPPGRQRSKELRALEEHRSKKLKMASESLDLQKRHVEELERQNDIQLFTSGPGGAESDMAKEFFRLKQEERLDAMRESAQKRTASRALDVLANIATDGDEGD